VSDDTHASRLHVRKDKTNVRRFACLALLIFANPPALPGVLLGVALVFSAVLLHGWAAGYLARAGYAERETRLTVRGPYRHTRNPYYLAHLIMDLGFFVLAGHPLIYLFYFPIMFSVYRTWVAHEERFLEQEFGADYVRLQQEVPRWGFRVIPATGRGSDLVFNWSTFKLNRELPRAISHLVLLTTFLIYYFLGNPFAEAGFLPRSTLLAVVALWFVFRDIYPNNIARVSATWTGFALISAGLMLALIAWAPAWQPLVGFSRWAVLVLGLTFIGTVWISVWSPSWISQKSLKRLLPRPICQWYMLGVAGGLLSCTLGGIWVGIMTPLTAWTLNVAGLVTIGPVPRRPATQLALLVLSICAGVFAATH